MDNQPMDEAEARQQPGVARVYRNEQIAVTWEPALCIHVGHCFRDLPEVFQPQNRPWVNINGATANRIAEQVRRCIVRARILRLTCCSGTATVGGHDRSAAERPVVGQGHRTSAEQTASIRRSRSAACRCGHSEKQTVLRRHPSPDRLPRRKGSGSGGIERFAALMYKLRSISVSSVLLMPILTYTSPISARPTRVTNSSV